jgi:hypothetical protein
MKKHYVVKNLPIRLPFQSTILYSFLLYHFHANGLIWGIFITLFVIYWILAIIVKLSEDGVVFDPDEFTDKGKLGASKFAQKIKDLNNKRNTN